MTAHSVVSKHSAVVIGGGLAGITAAIALREAGIGVTLLEARPRCSGAGSALRRSLARRPGDSTVTSKRSWSVTEPVTPSWPSNSW